MGLETFDLATTDTIICIPYGIIQPGDVLLCRSAGPQGAIISFSHSSGFSHAALFINKTILFEADDFGVGSAAQNIILSNLDQLAVVLLPGVTRAALFRHPKVTSALSNPNTNQEFLKSLDQIVESKTNPYSELDRLKYASGRLKPLFSILETFLETGLLLTKQVDLHKHVRDPEDKGLFCSEVVAQVLRDVGADPFADGRSAHEINPGDFTESLLHQVSGAVLTRNCDQLGISLDELNTLNAELRERREMVADYVTFDLHAKHAQRASDALRETIAELNKGTLSILNAEHAAFVSRLSALVKLVDSLGNTEIKHLATQILDLSKTYNEIINHREKDSSPKTPEANALKARCYENYFTILELGDTMIIDTNITILRNGVIRLRAEKKDSEADELEKQTNAHDFTWRRALENTKRRNKALIKVALHS